MLPQFSMLFRQEFREGNDPRSIKRPLELSFNEDDPESLLTLLFHIHYSTAKLPPNLTELQVLQRPSGFVDLADKILLCAHHV